MGNKVDNPLRNVKRVNGYKVNHPHSAANFSFTFFLLLVALAPALLTITPLVIKDVPAININGLIIYEYIFAGFKTNNANIIALQDLMGPDSILFYGLPYIITVLGGLTIAMAVFGVIAIIFSLITSIKGYAKHPKALVKLAKWQFIFALLFSLDVLSIYVIAAIKQASTGLNIWYTFALPGLALLIYIVLHIIYKTSFEDCVLEKDLEIVEQNQVNGVSTEIEPLSKGISFLPSDLTSIGNHQFSKNQDLQIADIPESVTALGPGAFANCLNLKSVIIPVSVKEIGFNCFFNCVSLESITYKGTKEQWQKIKRGSNWLAKSKTDRVTCSDNVIVVNQLR